jgi:hypothetical protein
VNTDIRVHIEFLRHAKTRRLIRHLGPWGPLCLIELWCYTARNRPDGVLRDMTAEDIEDAAGWLVAQPKREGQFFAYVAENRWLDRIDEGLNLWSVHEWRQYNPWASEAPVRQQQSKYAAHVQHHASKGISKPETCSWCAGSMLAAQPTASSASAPVPLPAPAPKPSPFPSPGSSSSKREETDGDGFRPLWTHNQFRFKADKIAKWINEQRTKRCVPGDEDFETRFSGEWGMSYDYWIEQRDRHEQHFRGAA